MLFLNYKLLQEKDVWNLYHNLATFQWTVTKPFKENVETLKKTGTDRS